MPGSRVRILCEDRLTERFLRRLCERFAVRVIDTKVAPDGRGAASAWVRRQYPASVRELRARRDQQNLGLLVGIDGDNLGRASRYREFAHALQTADEEPRADTEAIAIFTPTWSIETWLAHLSGQPGIREDRALKEDAALRHLWEDGRHASATLKMAVDAWGQAPDAVSSLADAYRESARVWLA